MLSVFIILKIKRNKKYLNKKHELIVFASMENNMENRLITYCIIYEYVMLRP